MNYFAGLFDAEGYISLCKTGHFVVGTELANEEIPNLFQKEFGGNIYCRKRDKRKKTWSWKLTNPSDVITFYLKIFPFLQLKAPQLAFLTQYIRQSRDHRKQLRSETIEILSTLKKPSLLDKSQINIETSSPINSAFLEWLAGFMDGDGNFCVYEYQGKKNIIFDSWISVFNTFPQAISFVKARINGSISKYKGNKFPIWKWVCSQKDSQFVCNSLYPLLKIKKEQCLLTSEFLKIQETKVREQNYSFDQINKIRDIIKQIKHLNSL